MLLEPEQPYHNDENVDEAHVCNHGNEVKKELLIRLEVLQINAIIHQSRVLKGLTSLYWSGSTYGFNPDSVEALHPKKYASIADTFPFG